MEEDTDMVEQSNGEYANCYVSTIRHLAEMVECKDNKEQVEAIRECFGKLGLYASASDFLRYMYDIRNIKVNSEELRSYIGSLGMEALLIISWYTGKTYEEIVESQITLFKVKNKRYGNSFVECFAKDGYPYAFGHLQEKINRICALLALDDEVKEEPIIDSYKDLLGYCVLTLVEIK